MEQIGPLFKDGEKKRMIKKRTEVASCVLTWSIEVGSKFEKLTNAKNFL